MSEMWTKNNVDSRTLIWKFSFVSYLKYEGFDSGKDKCYNSLVIKLDIERY